LRKLGEYATVLGHDPKPRAQLFMKGSARKGNLPTGGCLVENQFITGRQTMSRKEILRQFSDEFVARLVQFDGVHELRSEALD
jgi:hypothetical protein